ncbi:preprotein translocase subunit SecE [Hufsiella ginkgonis]|uniref:Protein translocase subunit SecE n=1 Tax=Hufsiella ginkgonis TaxID=2695274 RepID=A0A7K1Y3N9_9SPHI|nr:preprotein translocase subunit SecE [Hufsiella ginkgonis]MXV17861.1 preprotein translocase subunit SecE [Hufsiella ginkgonis]
MAGVVEFIKESYIEMTQKVSWPTRKELWSSAMIVLVASLIIAGIVFSMDQVAGNLLKLLYKSLT